MENKPKIQASKQKPFFRNDPITTVVLLAAVFFLSQVVAVFLVSLYPALRNWTESAGTAWLNTITGRFIFMLVAEALAIFGVFQLVKLARIPLRRIGIVRPRIRDLGWAFIAYGLYFLVFLFVSIVASQLIPSLNMGQEQQIGFENAYLTSELVMTFIVLVIAVPIAEEFMFRGFLFSSLRAKYNYWLATIATGILFGIAHLQFGSGAPLLWIAAIDTFILSCFLCYLREHLNSIWPAVCLHAIKNAVAFTLLFGHRLFL